ncbi:hypothetical protein [Pasteurella multocida]|uniref:hypothetical protein n=1 Tax=Pasteurella multocida TaxID=747 RepID=UPI001480C81D|nr:hypothetical protein [Pasteurella multocida]NNI07733.1 hypothetical protein [Pasteurella multocida]NNI33475.1 hypothetical protein [Pasteurella multocida]
MSREFPEKFAEFCQGVIALLVLGGFCYTLYDYLASTPTYYAWYELIFVTFLWLIPWIIVMALLGFVVKVVALSFAAILVALIDFIRPIKCTN